MITRNMRRPQNKTAKIHNGSLERITGNADEKSLGAVIGRRILGGDFMHTEVSSAISLLKYLIDLNWIIVE